MDSEEKRDILSRALVIDKDIQRLRDHLVDLQTGAIGSVNYGDKVQTSPVKGSAADTAVELLDEIQQKEADRAIEATLIERQLDRQPLLSENERKLLKLRYVRCLQWKEVAVLMGCTKRHSYRLEKQALLSINL